MIPQLVILELPDEFKYLSDTLFGFGYKDNFLEKVMEQLIAKMRVRTAAFSELDEYVEKLQYEEGEYVAKKVAIIGKFIFRRMLDIGAYLPNGDTPYEYGGREGFDYFMLSLDTLYELRPK